MVLQLTKRSKDNSSEMIRRVMKDKNIDSLETLIQSAIKNGIELVACQMSMDVMGIR